MLHCVDFISFFHESIFYDLITVTSLKSWFLLLVLLNTLILTFLIENIFLFCTGQMLRFREGRKHRTACFRYIYVLRKPEIASLDNSIKFLSCLGNGNVKSCSVIFKFVSVIFL